MVCVASKLMWHARMLPDDLVQVQIVRVQVILRESNGGVSVDLIMLEFMHLTALEDSGSVELPTSSVVYSTYICVCGAFV